MTLPSSKPTLREALPGTLVLAGAGKMGGALLDGWLDHGLEPGHVAVVDPHAPPMALERWAERGVAINPHPLPAADTLVLAIKPQMLAEAAPTLSACSNGNTLLVSVVAGKTVRDLASAFPAVRTFARAMPNTPAAVRRGVTGIFATETVTDPQRIGLAALLRAVGSVEWLGNEEQIDAVTALSGSGPAYVFLLTECLAQAGEKLGLDPAVAARLARATVEGAGALMTAMPDISPRTLRENVTSPGGTTAAAVAAFMQNERLPHLVTEAVDAAWARAKQLAG